MTEHFEPRQAVRALLVAEPEQRVLLIHTLVPDTNRLIWLAPGGGLEPGEAPEVGLVREVLEETGLEIKNWQGPVWHRRMKFKLHGKPWDQSELYYLVRTQMFKPDNSANPAADELSIFRGFRWWSLREIRAAEDEIFVPVEFAEHFERLLAGEVPGESYDVGR